MTMKEQSELMGWKTVKVVREIKGDKLVTVSVILFIHVFKVKHFVRLRFFILCLHVTKGKTNVLMVVKHYNIVHVTLIHKHSDTG